MTRFALGWLTGAASTLLGLLLVHLYGFWQSGAEEPQKDERLERVLEMRRLEYAAAGIEYDGEAVGV